MPGGQRIDRGRAAWALAVVPIALGLVLLAVLWVPRVQAALAGHSTFGPDATAVAPDFLTHYVVGRMALAGDLPRLYDLDAQQAARDAALPGAEVSRYLLPPATVVPFVPFALLPFPAAALAWTAVSFGLLAWAFRLTWRRSPLRGRQPTALVALALVGSYPFAMNLALGNNAALWVAVYALGARFYLSGRDIAAGLVLGFGALKPQLFLAVPVLLLAQRRWRALGTSAAVAVALGLSSLAVVGLEGARAYVDVLTSDFYRTEVALRNAWRMLSLPAFVRGVTGQDPSWVTAGIVAAGLGLLAWAVRRASPSAGFAAAVTISVAIAPHLFPYDGLVLAVPILLRGGLPGSGISAWALAAFWALTWWMGFSSFPQAGTFGGVPWAAIPVAVLAAGTLWGAQGERNEATGRQGRNPSPAPVPENPPCSQSAGPTDGP